MTTTTIRKYISYRCGVLKLASQNATSDPREISGHLAELNSLLIFCDTLDKNTLPSNKEWTDAGFTVPSDLCRQ